MAKDPIKGKITKMITDECIQERCECDGIKDLNVV